MDNSISKENEKYPMFKNIWYSNFKNKESKKEKLPTWFSNLDKFNHEMPSKMVYFINQF